MEQDFRIPEPARDVFYALKSEVTLIHANWIIYRQLYERSRERINLLNESASTFFALLQAILKDNTVLGISRLTDPPKTYKKENLVLEQIIQRLEGEAGHDVELVKTLRTNLQNVKVLCDPLRDIRNRAIAHLDLKTTIIRDPLPEISGEMLENSLESIRQFMSTFEKYFVPGHIYAYEYVDLGADGESLIGMLKRAMDHRDAMKEGEILPDRLGRMRFKNA